ncbi:MAG: CheR family methyltransferase [Desulfatibacillaceae bacterium]|nr:CheR family methyltransferase [Desulfatibacillaceae bacterium]
MPELLSENEFLLLKHLLGKKIGVRLRDDNRESLSRKLAKRVDQLGFSGYMAYYRFVKSQKGEKELVWLINEVTIDESHFFRADKQLFWLVEELIPAMMENRRQPRRLRIWCAGCARGQEPYTLSMMMLETIRLSRAWDLKILATDVDVDSLKAARRATYPAEMLKSVPRHYLYRYFNPAAAKEAEKAYTLKAEVKQGILFRKLNLLEFPYPLKGPMDIVFCRNVMIYFQLPDKKRILEEFFRLLAPGGYLCLGSSESLLGVDERFALVGQAIYQKKD